MIMIYRTQTLAACCSTLIVACGTDAITSPVRDTVPPRITLLTRDTVTGQSRIHLGGTAVDEGLVTRVTAQQHTLSSDGPIEDLAITPGTTVVFDAAVEITDGDHTVTFVAYDSAGNTAQDTVMVQADLVAPLLLPIAPYYASAFDEPVSLYMTDYRSDTIAVLLSVNGGKEEAVGVVHGARANSPYDTPFRFSTVVDVPLQPGVNEATFIGIDRAGNRGIAAATIRQGVTVIKLAAGEGHWCLLTSSGATECWGHNEEGQLGNGGTESSWIPAAVTGGHEFVDIAAGTEHTCALTMAGEAYCWGAFEWDHRPGTPRPDPRVRSLIPVAFSSPQPLRRLNSGWKHTCGLDDSGAAYCWGYNEAGQLGNGSTISVDEPSPVAGGLSFENLTAGFIHTCAMTVGGEAYCWGNNYEGEFGNGTTTLDPNPMPVPAGGGITFTSLSAGAVHTCGVAADGTPYCWGEAHSARLGVGINSHTAVTDPMPVLIADRFTSITAGYQHSCGIADWGGAACWGDRNAHEIGSIMVDPAYGYVRTPVHAAAGVVFETLVAGSRGTCGISVTGSLYCWGSIDNSYAPILPGVPTIW